MFFASFGKGFSSVWVIRVISKRFRCSFVEKYLMTSINELMRVKNSQFCLCCHNSGSIFGPKTIHVPTKYPEIEIAWQKLRVRNEENKFHTRNFYHKSWSQFRKKSIMIFWNGKWSALSHAPRVVTWTLSDISLRVSEQLIINIDLKSYF